MIPFTLGRVVKITETKGITIVVGLRRTRSYLIAVEFQT